MKRGYLVIIGFILLFVGIILFFINDENYLKYIGNIENDIVLVSDGSKYGYYDVKEEKLLIDLKYELPDSLKKDFTNLDMFDVKNGMFITGKKNKKYDFLYEVKNLKEETLFKGEYTDIVIYDENLIKVLLRGIEYYFVDNTGKQLTDFYSEMLPVDENNKVFTVRKDNQYGIINSDSEVIIEPKYNEIQNFIDGDKYIFRLMSDSENAYYIYDSEKKQNDVLAIDSKAIVKDFSENIIVYQLDEKFYVYNLENQKIVELSDIENIGKYSSSRAWAIKNEKVGYIDEEGKTIIPFEHQSQYAEDFSNGFVPIYDKKCNLYNENGQIVLKDYDNIEVVNNDRFIVYKNKEAKLVNKNNQKITKEKYSSITNNVSDKYLLTTKVKNDKTYFGLIDYDGNIIEECNYLDIRVSDNYLILKNKNNKNEIKKLN